MSYSLSTLTIEQRAELLRTLLRPVQKLLVFAQKEQASLSDFFTNLRPIHEELTNTVARVRDIITPMSVDEITIEKIKNLVDSVLYYLSFVKMPNSVSFEKWLPEMEEKIALLHREYNDACQILVRW